MITWKTPQKRYGSSVNGYIGEIIAFNIIYDGCRSQDESSKEKLCCSLPGIKPIIGHFISKEEAKDRAESILTFWLKKSGLKKDEKELK